MMNNMPTTLVDMVRYRQALPPPAMRRAIREAAGASRPALARELGVTAQAIALWEAGKRHPSPRLLPAYVALLAAIQEATS